MGLISSVGSTLGYGWSATSAVVANLFYGWTEKAFEGPEKIGSRDVAKPPSDGPLHEYTFLKNEGLLDALRKSAFSPSNTNALSDDAVTKICRQLEFWYTDGGLSDSTDEMIKMAETLVNRSTWYRHALVDDAVALVPKVRFGKTEIRMPIVTCGGMRFQNTWLPDFIPILRPSHADLLKSRPQENIKNVVRTCLKLGINHFETARFYGTSEFQLVSALHQLMEEGEIKREDFIFQTKIPPMDPKSFLRFWKQSWTNVGEKLGYIDLCSLHCCLNVDEPMFTSLAFLEERKAEGKVRHIGFSTHAPAEKIMALINTEKFEYVNIHYHYFGSYHAEGTPSAEGRHGNAACVRRALELDMGVFNISPFDKGGKLYRPTRDVALAVGKETSPMAFAALHAWKIAGMHTVSVGVARPSDLDEVLEAARLYASPDGGEGVAKAVRARLDGLAVEKLGEEWAGKGLVNVPCMYTEASDGMAIGHMLWMHNLLTAYGMYEFCKERYSGLEQTKWKKKKSFKENAKGVSPGNPGRSFDPSVDLTEALKDHYDPDAVLEKLRKVHMWLCKDAKFTDVELESMGWKKGYNLTVWEEYPGEIDSRALQKILLQNLTGGRLGTTGGFGQDYVRASMRIRSSITDEEEKKE